MGKPFDVSKFRKEITKSIDGLSIGFNDPTDWISTGNYALNYLIPTAPVAATKPAGNAQDILAMIRSRQQN